MNLLKRTDQVIPNRKNVQLSAIMKSIQDHYLIIVQRQICKIYQFFEALYCFDPIEGKIQPFEVYQVIDAFYLFNYVIVELQFLQS